MRRSGGKASVLPGRVAATTLCGVALLALAAGAQNGSPTGSIEFVARVAPSGARPEPMREMTFYLLRKSLADIQKEVEETETKPDLNQFIAGLEVSKKLKAWMKTQRTVSLAGSDFVRRLKPADVLNVPEFYDAYLKRNAGQADIVFPAPKYRERDRERNPEKYERQRQEYREALRKYMENNPQSIDGIEASFEEINPGPLWAQKESESRRRMRTHAVELAQTRYLAAKTDTDLDGRGLLTGLLPGTYWLGTLDTEAVAGDTRLRWDAPVKVQAGQTARVELSNLNRAR